MQAVSGPVFRFLEYLLIVVITYHAFNGVRLIVTEIFGWGLGKPHRPVYPYRTSIQHQRPLFLTLMILAFVFLIITAWGFLANP